MQVTQEKLAKSELKLIVEPSEDEMKKYKVKATRALQKEVKVPGFRAGKIPMEVLIEHMGEQSFLSVVLEFALEESYAQAVEQEKIRPADYPRLNILERDPLKYEATIALIPQLEFKKDPGRIELKRKPVEVKKEEVKEVMENFVKRTVEWADVEREAKKGDRVEIDFDGRDTDGVALEGTSSKNHPVILGSGSLIPGFEEEVLGMKKGEEKEFEIVFPKDYHSKSFQSKKVTFKVKLQRVEEGKEDELNDAFAQKVSGDPQKTLSALEKEIHGELKKQKEMQDEGRLEEEFLQELLKLVEAELPQALLEKEIDFLVERIKEDLKKQNRAWEEYENELKEKGRDTRKELEKPAREQVMLRLALERLFELENPEVTEEELEAEIERMVGHYPAEFQMLMKQRFQAGSKERESLRSQTRLKKLVRARIKD